MFPLKTDIYGLGEPTNTIELAPKKIVNNFTTAGEENQRMICSCQLDHKIANVLLVNWITRANNDENLCKNGAQDRCM